MSKPVVVIAEARQGSVKRPSLEACAAAVDLAAASGGEAIALVCGASLSNAKATLQKSGVAKVIAIESPELANYSSDGFAAALEPKLKELDPGAVLMTHSAMSKELLPRLAAMMDTGLLTDATALHFEGGSFGGIKPVYAGKATVKVKAEKSPFMATIRPNNFEPKDGGDAAVEDASVDLSAADFKSIVQEMIAASSDRVPLQEAGIVVAGGRGLKDPSNFHLVEELAEAFGAGKAAVGASRAVVDAGWRPHREQVGQTGKVVSPGLYIAVGISGAIQHLAGMRTSRTIVAINNDKEAPIFKVADFGIVGDCLEVLPKLTEAVKALAN